MISDVSLNTKALVRKEFRERARVFVQSPTLRLAADGLISTRVRELISSLSASSSSAQSSVVAGFNSLSDEVDLSSFYHSTSHELVFPKLLASGDVSAMEFTSVENYSAEKWEVSSLGFRHPSSVDVVPADAIQFMLIPGVAFSSVGERLGRGKGFYDRYLKNYIGFKIGVCFDCQVSEASLPTDSWDIKMDYIITETKCIDVRKVSV